MTRFLAGATLLLAICGLVPTPSLSLIPDHFESPPVHLVDMSADGTRLFVAHTADHRLVVFDLTTPIPTRIAEVMVGIEPVSVRVHTPEEVWVVNHISDSISIIDLATMSVARTLLVGDEPTDVAFVPAQHKAFVCVSQEDMIRIYDTNNLAIAPTEIALSMSDPRSLALSPERETLYVGALDSQNRTTTVPYHAVQLLPGQLPVHPAMRPELPAPPLTGLIVKHDGAKWTDEIGRNWNGQLPYQLLDHDVIAIDTSTLAVQHAFTGVGTTIFNLEVSPVTGHIYATNQDASNEIRFEPNVKGKFVKNRVTTIDPLSGAVTPKHLNDHIDYSNEVGSPGERALSLAIPLDVEVSTDGSTVYVAAFGSGKVGVLDATGVVTRRIPVGEGPCGLALDEARGRLYVMNRLASMLAVVTLGSDTVIQLPLGFDPTPSPIREGRRFLYDTELSSAHGDLACASCHVFGTMDNIAWDLGNPLGQFIRSTLPPFLQGFHPMKGPMMTQSLKGLPGTGLLHWRGDRLTLLDFNPAFVSLMGKSSPLTSTDFDRFQDFVFSMRYPPSPNRELDNSLPTSFNGASPQNGDYLFQYGALQNGVQCNDCHHFPTGTLGLVFPAEPFFNTQDFKVPQLRNLYEKTRFDRTATTNVRGFGFTHDGAIDDLLTFLDLPRFTFQNESDKRDVAAFLMAFDTGTHAAVGAQWTMDGTNEGAGAERLNTLQELAEASAVGLVAKGRDLPGDVRGWTYLGSGEWRADRAAEPPTTTAALLANADEDHAMTFTATLEGTQTRLGVDRDEDGFLDRDEIDAGTDPGDPASNRAGMAFAPMLVDAPFGLRLWHAGANPARVETRLGFSLAQDGPARLVVFDVQGRRVASLVDDPRHASGRFEARWNLRDGQGRVVAPGTYFVRLEGLQTSADARIVVLR